MALLGISCFKLSIPIFRLGLNILSLEDHILDCKGILKVSVFGQWRDLLTLTCPC